MKVPEIREAIIHQLSLITYDYLKKYKVFQSWESKELLKISANIVISNDKKINQHLDDKNYSIDEIDKAIKFIFKNIIQPEINKIRI
jgi:hypothetical protein